MAVYCLTDLINSESFISPETRNFDFESLRVRLSITTGNLDGFASLILVEISVLFAKEFLLLNVLLKNIKKTTNTYLIKIYQE